MFKIIIFLIAIFSSSCQAWETLKCDYIDSQCSYSYHYNSTNDRVSFNISLSAPTRSIWIALGFNTNNRMPGTDVIVLLYTDSDQSLRAFTGRNIFYFAPSRDSNSQVENVQLNITNGLFKAQFSTQRVVNMGRNFDLQNCYKIAIGLGSYSPSSDSMSKHSITPKFTESCIRIAEQQTTNVIVTTTRKPTTNIFEKIFQAIYNFLLNLFSRG